MTYSIVARDPDSGELGVAVQSHAFSVGTLVPWLEPGVGAVATQSIPLLDYGPRGLELMRGGATAPEALDALVEQDGASHSRQIGMVAADGTAASFSGSACIPVAGDHVGDGFAVQGNILASDQVVPAMVTAYTSAGGDLVDRMLAALDAAQSEGGDVRGVQSAALVTVSGQRSDQPWKHLRARLHVDDHPDPLVELRRLVTLRRAYDLLEEGDDHVAADDLEAAAEAYAAALQLAPGVTELRFWAAVSLFTAGVHDEARAGFQELVGVEPHWRQVLDHIAASDLFPDELRDLAR